MAEPASYPWRWDRLLALSPMNPAWRRVGKAREPRLSILMYHGISDCIDRNVHPYFQTVTTPRRFRSHMEHVRDSGMSLLSLGEAVRRLHAGRLEASERVAVVTFDDGLRDFYRNAYPILDRLGIPSTVFLASDYLDRHFLNGEECLRRSEVAELGQLGVEFGSHTATHPHLTTLDQRGIDRELSTSRDDIAAISGSPVTLFSYPYRFPEEEPAFTAQLENALASHGYRVGVTTRIGRATAADRPLLLPRLPVNDGDDIRLLEAKLRGAYDWMHGLQVARKRMRKIARVASAALRGRQ